jgi:hypothetical protein
MEYGLRAVSGVAMYPGSSVTTCTPVRRSSPRRLSQ